MTKEGMMDDLITALVEYADGHPEFGLSAYDMAYGVYVFRTGAPYDGAYAIMDRYGHTSHHDMTALLDAMGTEDDDLYNE